MAALLPSVSFPICFNFFFFPPLKRNLSTTSIHTRSQTTTTTLINPCSFFLFSPLQRNQQSRTRGGERDHNPQQHTSFFFCSFPLCSEINIHPHEMATDHNPQHNTSFFLSSHPQRNQHPLIYEMADRDYKRRPKPSAIHVFPSFHSPH